MLLLFDDPPRLIPLLLLKNGFLVQSKQFSYYQNLGNPVACVKRLSDWASDELIYLDITRKGSYDMRRDDIHNPNRNNIIAEDEFKSIVPGNALFLRPKETGLLYKSGCIPSIAENNLSIDGYPRPWF